MPQTSHAARHAERLLGELGAGVSPQFEQRDHPAVAWRRAGMLELSGRPGELPLIAPLPLASAADGALMALRSLADTPVNLPQSGAQLLGERARLMGLSRNGTASPAGHCRLTPCRDRRIALNLARDNDWELLPALFRKDVSDWAAIRAACREQRALELVERGAMLGMAIAEDVLAPHRPWLTCERPGSRIETTGQAPLVVDLSALWAGPLAASLIGAAGGRVIKVESTHRPDGARGGNPAFFDLLNSGKQSVALDFRKPAGIRALAQLLERADIVIEASRPRALRQLGVVAEHFVERQSGKVWLRVLAHGDDPNRIGFGDDIGVAAGLPGLMELAWGEALMVGDAITDPLTGLYAALAAWQRWQAGGGELLTVSMRDVVRHATGPVDGDELSATARRWQALARGDDAPLYTARQVVAPAEPLGHSNAAIMATPC